MAVTADADTIVSLITILILLASLSSALDLHQFLESIKSPKGIIIGIFCQYGILPVTAFALTQLFQLDASLGVALVIVGTCPGGAMSNFWCFMFNADLPLSIAMTTCSSILCFAFIAGNGALYIPIISDGTDLTLDWLSLGLSVAAVLIGIVIGMMIAFIHNLKLLKVMGVIGTITMIVYVLLLFIFGHYPINDGGLSFKQCTVIMIHFRILVWTLSKVGSSDAKLRDCPWQVFVSIAIMNTTSLSLSFSTALCLRLKRQSAVSVAIESSNQNAPLAIAILLLSLEEGYSRDLALNVPVIYMLMNVLFVLVFGITLRRTGWLPLVDDEDRTMTFGKIIRAWRQSIATPNRPQLQSLDQNSINDGENGQNASSHPIQMDSPETPQH